MPWGRAAGQWTPEARRAAAVDGHDPSIWLPLTAGAAVCCAVAWAPLPGWIDTHPRGRNRGIIIRHRSATSDS